VTRTVSTETKLKGLNTDRYMTTNFHRASANQSMKIGRLHHLKDGSDPAATEAGLETRYTHQKKSDGNSGDSQEKTSKEQSLEEGKYSHSRSMLPSLMYISNSTLNTL
jgi:hypothetical protein